MADSLVSLFLILVFIIIIGIILTLKGVQELEQNKKEQENFWKNQ